MIAASILVVTIIAMAAVCLAVLGATMLARFRRVRRQRTLLRLAARHRVLILEVASGEDEDGLATGTLAGLPASEWTGIRTAVIAMLSKVRGAPAAQLVQVLDAHGELDRARTQLDSRSSVRRARGAHLLGLARDEQSTAALIRLLGDPAAEVRLVAARSLGMIKDASAADDVLRAVPGVGSAVGVPAWVAAEALLAMGPAAEAVVQAGLVDPDPRIRGVAVMVAGHSILPTTLDVLRARLVEETDPVVRAGVAAALGRIGTAADVEQLARHTGSEQAPGFRRTCATALGELGQPDSADRLVGLLADPDRRLAQLSAQALVQLGPVGMAQLHAARAQGQLAGTAAAAALALATLRGLPGAEAVAR